MITWIIGMSGAGKTTLGRELVSQWKRQDPATVLVDGDEIRAVFAADRGDDAYTIAGRRRNAERIVGICSWLDQQQINAVCCVLCIFPDVLAENRRKFSNYFEIFVDAPMERLVERDSKGLYAAARKGTMPNVVGVDIPFPRPQTSDLVVENSAPHFDVPSVASEVLARLLRGQTRRTA